MHRLWIFCTICCVIYNLIVRAEDSKCNFVTPSPMEKELMLKLNPLIGKRSSITGTFSNKTTKYQFDFGFCTDAIDKKEGYIGMAQTEVDVVDVAKEPKQFVLGRYNNTQIKGGDNWVFLIYKDGDKYHTHCEIKTVNGTDHRNREAHIMITCNPNTELSTLQVIEENNDENEECYYLFELTSKYVCPAKPKQQETLGAGSIFCIIFFTTAGVYLIIGFLYQRIVVGAKGLEQIPNFSFWKEFGKLQADGCDFLCRCGERQEMKMYRGIDDQLLNTERREEPDDRLLPM